MENKYISDLAVLLQRLRDNEGEGFVVDEPAFEAAVELELHTPTSWIIRVVTMLGAWLAAACFFGMIGLMGVFESPIAMGGLGLVLMVLAVLAFRSIKKNIFMIPLALTASITGQICFSTGIGQKMTGSDYTLVYVLEMFIQVGLFFATTNNVQKFIATLVFNGFLVTLLFSHKWYEAIHFVLGVNVVALTFFILWEERILDRYKFWISSYQPLTAGITVSFLMLIFTNLIARNESWQEMKIHYWWISTAVMLSCLGVCLYKIALDFERSPLQILVIGLVFLPLVGSPGILAGILILLLGFYHKSVWYISMGILTLAVFISIFYYDLHITLWAKSLILMGSGLLFLAVFFVIHKYDKKLGIKNE